MKPFAAGTFNDWLWLCDWEAAGEERKKSGEEVGGACDCDSFCDDRALPRGVICSSPAAGSGRMGSLLMGASEPAVPRGVPFTEFRLERRDAGDDMLAAHTYT